MKHYIRDVNINIPLESAWSYFADLNNFGRFNVHHDGVQFLTTEHRGVGVHFKTGHTFWPIFPIPPLETICTVALWEKNEKTARIIVLEKPIINLPSLGHLPVPYTGHTQEYSLSSNREDETNFRYEVLYHGLPAWMKQANKNVDRKVLAVMDKELAAIKELLEQQ